MQPSDKYASTEVTEGGFTYKKTNSDIQTLFTLNDTIDDSIAYTEALPAEFNDASMIGWRDNSSAAYIQKSLVWTHNYKSSSSQQEDNRYNRLNKIEINLGASNFSGRPYIVFSTGAYGNFGYYSFGIDQLHGAIDNYNLGDKNLVTDFEVNKAVWRVAVLKGYQASDITAYLADGTEASEQDIDVSAFFANPSGYYINKFGIERCGTWNGSSWDTNGPNFGPLMLWDSAVSTGLYALNAISGGNTASPQASTGYGFGNKADVSTLFNTNKDNTTNVAACNYQSFTLQREFLKGFMLGTGAFTATIEPYEDTVQLDNYCALGDTNSHALTPRIISPAFNDRLVLIERDNYTLAKDYSTASSSHVSSYHKYITRLIKGESISKLLACCGVYFFRGNLTDLNSSGATPTHMDVPAMMLGEMNEGGFTTGNWIKGEDIDDYEGPNKDGSIIHTGFHPGPPGPSGTDEDSTSTIPTTGAPFATGLAHYYITTADSTVLQDISDAMSTWDIDTSKKDLYRNLISCKLVKPPAPVPSTPGLTFTIYGVAPEKDGSPITITGVAGNPTASFGPYSIPLKFGDFRDYAPYSKAEIFLPYCGWCALPSHVIGRSVSVSYYTDIIAATCKAIVYCGANPVAEAAGVIGLDIPFAAENVGAKMEAANAGLLATASGGLQTAIGVGTMVTTKGQSGGKQVMSGLSQYISGFTQMSMAANENWTEISGKTGDGCNIAGLRAIVIKITRPKYGTGNQEPTYTPAGFGHSVGYTSMKAVTVGSVTGLLIADNVDTSGISGATERERQLIKNYLESGIIVNPAGE